MKIQLISDTHLEMRPIPESLIQNSDRAIDVLILAGDISLVHLDNYKEFLRQCSSNYSEVILIAGNHEYYHGKGVDKVEEIIHRVVDEVNGENQKQQNQSNDSPNLHYLQRNYVDIQGVRFLGCTLWADIPQSAEFIVKNSMTDYQRIRLKIQRPNETYSRKEKINPKTTTRWHHRDVEWLDQQIGQSPLPVVVATHHAPSYEGTLNPKYRKSDVDYAYATDLELQLFHPDKVVLWCYGHTHWHNRRKIYETTIWSNPLGYPGESTGYRASEFFEL